MHENTHIYFTKDTDIIRLLIFYAITLTITENISSNVTGTHNAGKPQ